MGIIKWLNSHAIPATIFYFALMGGIAWGVNQSIADRAASTDIEGVDLLAIYDDSEAAGRSISVTNFRGDNLNAIVNAETGVSDPQITMYDIEDTAGTAKIIGLSAGGSNAIVMSLGVEDTDSTTGSTYVQFDGTDQVTKYSRPAAHSQRIIIANTSAGDYTVAGVSGELGTDLEDWNGVTIGVIRTSGDFDVIIPDCDATMTINGVSSTIADYDAQIEICQAVQSQTVSVVSASGTDNFQTRDGTGLTDGFELDSPGGAMKWMCVTLVCVPSAGGNGVWGVMRETGGTDAIDPTWAGATAD